MSKPMMMDGMEQFLDLAGEVMSARNLDQLPEMVLPGVSRFAGNTPVFLYITAPQLFTPRFYGREIPPGAVEQIKKVCEGQLDRLASLPPSATTPRSWRADAQFTVYPLRDGDEYVGLLGIALGNENLPISSRLWDRYLEILSANTHRLAEQRKIERQLAHLNTYLTVSSMLAQSLGLHDMLEAALYCCMDVVSAETATVLLLDDDKKNFLFYQVEGPTKPVLMSATFPADHGIAGAILQSGMSEVINDVHNDPRFYGKIDDQSGYKTHNMIALPLVAGEEQVGVLEVLNKTDGKDFSEEEHLSLMMIAEEVAFAVRNARIFEYVVNSYCKQRQGLNTCAGCKRPLGSWTPCVRYRDELL